MTPDRFRQIVEAYGANPKRWPESERHAAKVFAHESVNAQALLAKESLLDDMLVAHRIAPTGSALTARILASASRPATQAWSWVRLLSRGAGIAGVGIAGAAAGALLVSMLLPMDQVFPDDGERPIVTAFDLIADDSIMDDMQ